MIYEYECRSCDKTFEDIRSLTDPPLQKCPICGSEHVKRLISKPNFILKGSCWSKDNYSTQLRNEIKNLPQSNDDD